MPEPEPAWTDEQMEIVLGRFLRAGVILAAVIVLIGGILYLASYGLSSPDYRVFRGEPADLRNVSGILANAFSLHSRGLIQLGLLFLVAVPVGRVAFSVFVFMRQRDRTYVIVTSIVLILLLYSLSGWRM